MTGKGPNTWATPYYPHHDVKECNRDEDTFSGTVCDSTVQVRRLAFYGMKESALFMGMGFRITPYDDSLFSDKTGTLPSASEKEYLLNKTKAGVIFFKDR